MEKAIKNFKFIPYLENHQGITSVNLNSKVIEHNFLNLKLY